MRSIRRYVDLNSEILLLLLRIFLVLIFFEEFFYTTNVIEPADAR